MLNFPGVLLRTSTERPEVLDKGTLVIGGIEGKELEQSIELATAMWDNDEKNLMADDYKDNNISIKVIKLIQSYVGIINRTIWKKI